MELENVELVSLKPDEYRELMLLKENKSNIIITIDKEEFSSYEGYSYLSSIEYPETTDDAIKILKDLLQNLKNELDSKRDHIESWYKRMRKDRELMNKYLHLHWYKRIFLTVSEFEKKVKLQ